MLRVFEELRSLWSPLYFNVQLDITNACNLSCSHCYHSHHRNEGALDLAGWKSVIQRIESFSQRTRMRPKLILCGGEPLVSPLLQPLTRLWSQTFPDSTKALLTNGTLLLKPADYRAGLTRTHAEWIASEDFSVQVSLDGPEPSSHDRIRGPGNFDKTIAGIRSLVHNGVSVTLLAVLTRDSSRRIESFFKIAKSLNVSAMNFERVVPLGHADELSDSERVHGSALKEAMQSILHFSRAYEVKTSTRGALWADIAEGLGSPDTLGFYDWIIDYRGNMKLSSRTDLILGHVLRDDPESILFQHLLLRNLRKGRIKGCGGCELFRQRRCSGNRNIAYAVTGNFLGPDPDCWRIISNEKKPNSVGSISGFDSDGVRELAYV